MFSDYHSILARWRNHFSQLLNIHEVNDVTETETHTTKPLVPDPSAFNVEVVIEKLKSHKSPGWIKSQQNCLRRGVEQFTMRSINLLFLFGIRRNYPRSEGISRCRRRAVKRTVNYRGISLLPTRYKILSNILLSKLLHMQRRLLGIIKVNVNATGQLLIIYSAFVKYLKKIGNTTKQCIIFL